MWLRRRIFYYKMVTIPFKIFRTILSLILIWSAIYRLVHWLQQRTYSYFPILTVLINWLYMWFSTFWDFRQFWTHPHFSKFLTILMVTCDGCGSFRPLWTSRFNKKLFSSLWTSVDLLPIISVARGSRSRTVIQLSISKLVDCYRRTYIWFSEIAFDWYNRPQVKRLEKKARYFIHE